MAYFRRALNGGKEHLSKDALAEILALNGPRPWRFASALIGAWVVIGISIAVAILAGNPIVSFLAILVVGTRQNVLGLLVHEQAHYSLGGRWGDWVANILCAYPLVLIAVDSYAPLHLTHHREFSLKADPDFQRKSGVEWEFPMRPLRLARLFLCDILAINTVRLFKGKRLNKPSVEFARRHAVPRWLRPVFFAFLFIVLAVTGWWPYFLLYWMLPLLLLMPAIVRWGAICEHDYARGDVAVSDATPVIMQTTLERLVMPNLNFGLHPYHHFFPGVSWSQLPRVHAIFVREGLVNEENVYYGYWPFLKAVLGRQ